MNFKITFKLFALFTIVLSYFSGYSQQNVYSRGEVSTPYWWDDSTHPWYYQTWNNTQNRPDVYPNGTYNYVKIGHNNNLNMIVNGAYFNMHALTLEAGATSVRTFSVIDGGGFNLSQGLYNDAIASHNFNVPVVLTGSNVQFAANAGNLTFQNTINLQSHTAEFTGGQNVLASGVISGTGNISKTGNGALELTGANTYTGTTTVNSGILRLNAGIGGTLPATSNVVLNGGTLRISTNQTINNLTIAAGATLQVDANATLTLTGTYSCAGTINNLGTISLDFTANQSFPGAQSTIAAMNNLRLNCQYKEVTLNKSFSPSSVYVAFGKLILGSYTIDRATPGGSFTLQGVNAMLDIGGTGTFPANYTSHSLGYNSNVWYTGSDQVVAPLNSNEEYHYLRLTGDGTKTFGGDVIAYDVTIEQSDVIVANGQNFTARTTLMNDGQLLIENNANFIQDDGSNYGGNPVTVVKDSSPLYRLDYTIWSSPVMEQNLQAFSPETLSNRFYQYDTAIDEYIAVDPTQNSFQPGEGYLIRVPNTFPDYAEGVAGTVFTGSFVGEPNTGTVNVSVPTQGEGYSMVGNPYPSPINIWQFIDENTGALVNPGEQEGGTLYFWRKTNNPENTSFATITKLGYNQNNALGGDVGGSGFVAGNEANWVINQGQGFFIQAKANGTGLVKFESHMRRPVNNNQFFRISNTSTDEAPSKSVMSLNLTSSNGKFSQSTLGYTDVTTMGMDYGWDGRAMTDGSITLYSLLEDKMLAIQARAQFNANDAVPMGVEFETAGTYTLALNSFTGVFEQGQDIYLKDNFTGGLTNLKEGSYTFAAEAGTFNERFEIIYTTVALGTESPVNANAVAVYNANGMLTVDTGSTQMSDVAVFDLRGRVLYCSTGLATTHTELAGLEPQGQVLIVKVSTGKGTVSKKIGF